MKDFLTNLTIISITFFLGYSLGKLDDGDLTKTIEAFIAKIQIAKKEFVNYVNTILDKIEDIESEELRTNLEKISEKIKLNLTSILEKNEE